MRSRPNHPTAVLWLAFAFALALATASPAVGRPLISVGGGLATTNAFGGQTQAPLAVVSARAAISQRVSVFLRAGYEAHTTSEPMAVCLGTDCPSAAEQTSRARYVPLAWGLRFSSSDPTSARPFIDLASSLSWVRFEEERSARYFDGTRVTAEQASRHWLPGVEVGAGVQHRLGAGIGLEWELRYAYLTAPRQSFIMEKDGLTRVAFILALTL